jgi:hypothetical protein
VRLVRRLAAALGHGNYLAALAEKLAETFDSWRRSSRRDRCKQVQLITVQ